MVRSRDHYQTEDGESDAGTVACFFATVNPTVFTASAIVIVLFVLFGVVFTETANTAFSIIRSGITHYFGWFYILTVTLLLGFLIWLSLSRYGTVRLGQPYDPLFACVSLFRKLQQEEPLLRSGKD